MPDGLDGELLERFVQGDQSAFESLFRQFEAVVYRWILRIVRDRSAADDVLVEAFWRAYRGILLGRALELFHIQMWFALPAIPVGMIVYHLAWKFLVGLLNQEMGIA
jgi:hypothetical protein